MGWEHGLLWGMFWLLVLLAVGIACEWIFNRRIARMEREQGLTAPMGDWHSRYKAQADRHMRSLLSDADLAKARAWKQRGVDYPTI